MRRKIALLLLMIITFASVSYSQTQEKDRSGTFSLYFENDTVAGTDRCFTGGAKLGWMSRNLKKYKEKKIWKWLPFVDKPGFQHTFALSLGMNIYTPDDISPTDIIEDDRPYAGFLYLTAGIHSISQHILDSWEFYIGIVGPHSYAEQTQKFIHTIITGVYPEGWDNQLKDELALQLIYERRWKFSSSDSRESLGFDVIPHLGGGLGNVYIYGSTGVQVRLGWNLPEDFGFPLIRPGGDASLGLNTRGPFSVYAFAAMDGKAVLRNIFLDGNTFQDSHSVDKNPFTLDLITGIGIRMGRFNISYAYVFWTKKFKTETRNQVFGALNFSYSY